MAQKNLELPVLEKEEGWMNKGLGAETLGWGSLIGCSPGRVAEDGGGRWKEPTVMGWGYWLLQGAGGIKADLITAESGVCPGRPKPLPWQTQMLRLEVSKEQEGHQGFAHPKGTCQCESPPSHHHHRGASRGKPHAGPWGTCT